MINLLKLWPTSFVFPTFILITLIFDRLFMNYYAYNFVNYGALFYSKTHYCNENIWILTMMKADHHFNYDRTLKELVICLVS